VGFLGETNQLIMNTLLENRQDLLNVIKDAKYFYEYYESYAEDAKRQGKMEVYWNMQDSIEEQRSIIFRATEKLNQQNNYYFLTK